MNCAEFEAAATELARGGELDTPSEEQARAHAAACESCRARLAAQQQLSHGLWALAAEVKDQVPSPRLEQALRQAFRQNARPPAPPPEPARSWRVRWRAAAAAAAVAAAIAVALLLVDHDPGAREAEAVRPAWEKPPAQNALVAPDPVIPELGNGETLADSGISEPSPKVQPLNPAAAAQSPAASRQEVLTGFFPLLYEESWNEMSHAQLVRVSLPRSALLEFGFPLRDGGAADRVQADVLLAEDGTARAIRFVHPRPDSARASER